MCKSWNETTAVPKISYSLIKINIHNNRLQVLNQYGEVGERTKQVWCHRAGKRPAAGTYWVKRLGMRSWGVQPDQTLTNVNSFWAASGLYEYVQLFVIPMAHIPSYSNTTAATHQGIRWECQRKSKKTRTALSFTSYWADGSNHVIADSWILPEFFAKHTS